MFLANDIWKPYGDSMFWKYHEFKSSSFTPKKKKKVLLPWSGQIRGKKLANTKSKKIKTLNKNGKKKKKKCIRQRKDRKCNKYL